MIDAAIVAKDTEKMKRLKFQVSKLILKLAVAIAENAGY